jgi:hypothetical protein
MKNLNQAAFTLRVARSSDRLSSNITYGITKDLPI